MTDRALRVVHYLNQFFGGVGGEEAASHALEVRTTPAGPGLALQAALGESGQVIATIVCGDNAFHEQRDHVLEGMRTCLADLRPDLVVAGPAFAAGRYGAACADVALLAADLHIPAVVGLHPDNPAVALCRSRVHIVPVPQSPRTMAEALGRMARLGARLAAGEAIGSPEKEGYLPRGVRRHVPVESTGAERAVDLLLAKLRGDRYSSEIAEQAPPRRRAAPGLRDLPRARIAVISTGGIVPAGNPDGLRHINESRWRQYSVSGVERMEAGRWEPIHGGYDAAAARQDPNVVVPLDVLRALEASGAIGGVHDQYVAVVGIGAPVEVAERIGGEIAVALRAGEVSGAILTST
jgi:glycine reductase